MYHVRALDSLWRIGEGLSVKQIQSTEFIVLVPVLLALLGMTFAICVDAYLGRKNKRAMLMIAALIFTLVLQNTLDGSIPHSGGY